MTFLNVFDSNTEAYLDFPHLIRSYLVRISRFINVCDAQCQQWPLVVHGIRVGVIPKYFMWNSVVISSWNDTFMGIRAKTGFHTCSDYLDMIRRLYPLEKVR